MLTHRGVEQLAARWAHNPKVVSSSLTPATKLEIVCINRYRLFYFFNYYKYNVRKIHEELIRK